MRFQPRTLKQASSGPSSQPWVDLSDPLPCPLRDTMGRLQPSDLSGLMALPCHRGWPLTPPQRPTLSPQSSSHTIITDVHWRRSINMKNNWFSSPLPHSFSEWSCLPCLTGISQERKCYSFPTGALGSLSSPPPPSVLAAMSRLAATPSISLADAAASSAWLTRILCWAPPVCCIPPAKIPKPASLLEPTKAQLQEDRKA